jgi:hypothetical protein
MLSKFRGSSPLKPAPVLRIGIGGRAAFASQFSKTWRHSAQDFRLVLRAQ